MDRRHASANYLAAAIDGADALGRVVLLFQGCARFIRAAIRHIEAGRPEAAHQAFVKAKRIVAHLLASIPEADDSDLAANLRGLFQFAYRQLLEANVRKDPALAEAALQTLRTLAGAWTESAARPAEPAPPREAAATRLV